MKTGKTEQRNCPCRKLRPLLDFCMFAGFEPPWLERRNLRCACSAVHAHVCVCVEAVSDGFEACANTNVSHAEVEGVSLTVGSAARTVSPSVGPASFSRAAHSSAAPVHEPVAAGDGRASTLAAPDVANIEQLHLPEPGPELTASSQLLRQIVQHQAQMQQQLNDIQACLAANSSRDGLACSFVGCPEEASANCVAVMCRQHCTHQVCAAHRTNRAVACRHDGCQNSAAPGCLIECCDNHCRDRACVAHSGHGVSEGDQHVTSSETPCRRPHCAQHVAGACVTGYFPSHCTSRRCPCRERDVQQRSDVPAAPGHTRQLSQGDRVRTCRRNSCNNSVARNCRTGYCSSHCTSMRCSCHSTRQPAGGDVVRAETPEQRLCRLFCCRNLVANACRTGYCRVHCHSRRCGCSASGTGNSEMVRDPVLALRPMRCAMGVLAITVPNSAARPAFVQHIVTRNLAHTGLPSSAL